MSNLVTTDNNLALQLTEAALQALTDQRNQLKKFISHQLAEGSDFGTIPGTPKPCLYKPCAQKLTNIFKLGSRIIKNEETIDRVGNYAQVDITVEVYNLATGVAMATCEGIANSHESKNRIRSSYEWINGKKIKTGEIETPIGDLLNTLSKMAQKRAFVGAVLLATNASDFFTQDLEDMPNMEPIVNNEKVASPIKKTAAPVSQSTAGSIESGGDIGSHVMTKGNVNVKGKMLSEIAKRDLEGWLDYFDKPTSGAVVKQEVSLVKKWLAIHESLIPKLNTNEELR